MWKFIKYELKYWLHSPMLWIFLLVNTLLIFGAISTDNISIGGGVGSVHKNAPYVIQMYYGIMSIMSLLMTTAFMNSTANRDFQYNMHQFVFSSPIKKRDYYFGKFIGAVIISVIPLLGVSLGSIIGPFMPWVEPSRYGDIIWSGHLQGIITFAIPNTIIVGVLLYSLAVLFRSNIVSFIGSMLILVFYIVSLGFTKDIEKEWLANILDPFGLRPERILSKYLTVDEKNLNAVALSGQFLFNRVVWLSISFVILFVSYLKFSFSTKKEKVKKESKQVDEKAKIFNSNIAYKPNRANVFSLKALWYLIKFETHTIIKNPTFIIIIGIGLINLITSLTSFTTNYGADQYPVTYSVIDQIKGSFYLYIIAIITFYPGVLVWKDRDYKMNEIQDATPVKSGLLFTSKLIALLVVVEFVLMLGIFVGMIAQTAFGYTNYEIDVYFKSLLVSDFFTFATLIVIALFFQYIINNRYVAYFSFVVFVILNVFIWQLFDITSNMLIFGSTPSAIYSDMNGFGPYVDALVWFNIYWILASIVIVFVIFSFYIRGKELGFNYRMKNAIEVLSRNKYYVSASIVLFALCASYVFYNTQIINKYDAEDTQENKQIAYEKTFKKYENTTQPHYYNLNFNIDISPYERCMSIHIDAWARNISNIEISEIHFTMPQVSDSLIITIAGSKIKLRNNDLKYRIYQLDKPLKPNDSILIRIDNYKITKGFENEVSFTQLTQNGTFFNSKDILPSFGYNKDYEISDKNKRIKFDLPKRNRMPKLDENNFKARANTYFTNDADWVNVTTTISTSADQIAIAPGSLIKSWSENGKKYFKYTLDHKSLNFYTFISAKYEIARQKWNGIDLEVYYIKQHDYNVPNMLRSMQKSLEYYTKNFGPYYHKQCRIIEFPRYSNFAQSFPGTMPYGEGIGFITDLRNVTKEDIDLVYYVVAHEIGHQYWAHQVCGADMQGSEMMSEGFSQYSALMVMEKEYGKDKMKKFLKYEMNSYLSGRGNELEAEQPLMKAESQQYIHYAKASVVMYNLKEMIGENNVNVALRSLIDTFAYKEPPYPTSISAVKAFRKVTPYSLQYIIDDIFEHITLFSNRVMEANYKKIEKEYEVTIKTISEKFRADSFGKETNQPIADFIDIGVFAETENELNMGKVLILKRFKITKKENTFTFKTKELPYQVGIDPYNYLIDRYPEDNVKKVVEE